MAQFPAVRDDLSYHIDGITPGLLISPVCKMLRKAFASHYRYRTERTGGTARSSHQRGPA